MLIYVALTTKLSLNYTAMTNKSKIQLSDYFENFTNKQIRSGRYKSASDVIKAALMLLEQKENKLTKELIKGEQSGFVQKFDNKKFLNKLHSKHVTDAL